MQLRVFVTLKNLNLNLTNQTLRLGNYLQKTAAKLENRLVFYAEKYQLASVQPRVKCTVDVAKQSTYFDLKVDNFTCAY